MRFLIHMSTSEEAGSLARMLRLWTWSTCADMETELWSPGVSGPAIVIWDLDAGLPPPGMVSSASTALLVCSSRTQAAIDSYSLHPDGFLQKPIQQKDLFTVLRRCARLWWDSLERLEILSDRLRVRLPLCDLIWAEGARRGCLVHSSQRVHFKSGVPLRPGGAPARGPLFPLPAQLPGESHPRSGAGQPGAPHVRRGGDSSEPEQPGGGGPGLSAGAPPDGGGPRSRRRGGKRP